MPELSVLILTSDEDQRTLLPILVDGTAIARTVNTIFGFPLGTTDPVVRRIKDAHADVILIDIPPRDSATALRAGRIATHGFSGYDTIRDRRDVTTANDRECHEGRSARISRTPHKHSQSAGSYGAADLRTAEGACEFHSRESLYGNQC